MEKHDNALIYCYSLASLYVIYGFVAGHKCCIGTKKIVDIDLIELWFLNLNCFLKSVKDVETGLRSQKHSNPYSFGVPSKNPEFSYPGWVRCTYEDRSAVWNQGCLMQTKFQI